MQELDRVYLEKAEQNLAAAQSEFINDRYDSSASRSYYACFQAAIYALAATGIRASGERWGHDFVQAQFNGELINRRRLYPASLRGVLNDNYTLRQQADYSADHVNERRASRAVARAEELLEAIRSATRR